MLIAIDVQYADSVDKAGIGGLVLEHWESEQAILETTDIHIGLVDYVPGQFYRRELPCIMPTLTRLLDDFEIAAIIVDGYVDVTPDGPSLGRHLFRTLEERVEIVGVAKSQFADTHATPVLRGESRQPLWVTSTGDQEAAAKSVMHMHGDNRFPLLLKRTDRLAREALNISLKLNRSGRE
jgi:deoxyinosine 3'endonuclease (endonuclease V)